MFRFIKRLAKALDELDEPLTYEGQLRLMRRLLRERMQRDPDAVADLQAAGIDLLNIPETDVKSTPDALTVVIVMNYIDGKRDGFDDEELLRSIHSRFSATFKAAHTPFPLGPLPTPLTLRSLVRYFIDSQHGHCAPVPNEVIDYEIQQTFKWYDRGSVRDQATGGSVNPPAVKEADPRQATILAKDLLAGHIPQQEILSEIEAFLFDHDEPLSYSTHDLALSVALKFFTQPEHIPQLFQAQLLARVKALQWHREGLVATNLVKSFEEALYELYKPDYHITPQ